MPASSSAVVLPGLLPSALATRGSRDAGYRDPRFQRVKGAHFEFDYSKLDPSEQHTARSCDETRHLGARQSHCMTLASAV